MTDFDDSVFYRFEEYFDDIIDEHNDVLEEYIEDDDLLTQLIEKISDNQNPYAISVISFLVTLRYKGVIKDFTPTAEFEAECFKTAEKIWKHAPTVKSSKCNLEPTLESYESSKFQSIDNSYDNLLNVFREVIDKNINDEKLTEAIEDLIYDFYPYELFLAVYSLWQRHIGEIQDFTVPPKGRDKNYYSAAQSIWDHVR